MARKKKTVAGKQVTLTVLVTNLLAEIRDELLDSSQDVTSLKDLEKPSEDASDNKMKVKLLEDIKRGSLDFESFFSSVGLDWSDFISFLIMDLHDSNYYWGKKEEEIRVANPYLKKWKPPPYYECGQPLCRLIGPREIFLLDQPDLYDDAGNPQVRYQCPDCKGFAISKSVD